MSIQEKAQKIEANKAKFLEANAKYNLFTPELLAFLGEKLYEAPASTTTDLHNCYPGGLIDHLLRVAKYATHLNKLLPANLQSPIESVLRVAFMSEIGKVFLYELNSVDWQIKKGQYYTFREDATSMKIGERSAYYGLKYGDLTQVEYQALINYDKTNDDPAVRWHTLPLGVVLRQAIELAIMEEKAQQ